MAATQEFNRKSRYKNRLGLNLTLSNANRALARYLYR